jgi:hypothetical protein
MLAPFEEDVASLRSRPAPIIAQERVKGTSRIENPLHGAGSGRQARCVWLGSTSRAAIRQAARDGAGGRAGVDDE